MNILNDPVAMRGLERLVIAFGAITFAILGYRLFIFGVTKGHGKLVADSKLFKVVFSGTGPGLFFMAFGAVVLVSALFTGSGSRETIDGLHHEIANIGAPRQLDDQDMIKKRIESLQKLQQQTEKTIQENDDALAKLRQQQPSEQK
jgi:hypothetical protein